jgi:large subunit ribosomal protein L30
VATKSTSAKATADRLQAKPGRLRAERASARQASARRLKVTQIRSGIGFDKKQTLALRGLGLRRLNHTVDVVDTPSTRGLILKVRHLVTVAEGN